jgi:hypothetical protein
MTEKEAIHLMRTEKEVVALNARAYLIFLVLGMELLGKGIANVAKVTKGY